MEYANTKWTAGAKRYLLHAMIKAEQYSINFRWKTEFDKRDYMIMWQYG